MTKVLVDVKVDSLLVLARLESSLACSCHLPGCPNARSPVILVYEIVHKTVSALQNQNFINTYMQSIVNGILHTNLLTFQRVLDFVCVQIWHFLVAVTDSHVHFITHGCNWKY